MPDPDRPTTDPDDRPTAEVLASTVAHVQALVSKEVELAKLELTQVVTEKAIAAGTMVAAAVLGQLILGFIGVTGAKALELVVAPWLAWLIVTVVYLLLAAGLLVVGVRYAKRPVMELTTRSAEESVAWAKRQVGQ